MDFLFFFWSLSSGWIISKKKRWKWKWNSISVMTSSIFPRCSKIFDNVVFGVLLQFLFGYGHRMYEYVHSFSAVSVRTRIFPTVCTYYRRKNCTCECTDGFYSSTVRTYGAKTDCTYIYLLIDQLKLPLVL